MASHANDQEGLTCPQYSAPLAGGSHHFFSEDRVKHYWPENVRQIAEKLVHRLIEARTPQGWTFNTLYAMDRHTLSRISADPEFVDRHMLRALKDLVRELPSAEQLRSFEHALRAIADQEHRRISSQKQRWRLWIGIDAQLPPESPISSVRILGNRFVIASTDRFRKRLARDIDRSDEFDVRRNEIGNTAVVWVTHAVAASHLEAYHAIDDAMETLRGVLEGYASFGTMTIGYGLQPRHRIPPPTWCLATPQEGRSEVIELAYPSTTHHSARNKTSAPITVTKIRRDLYKIMERPCPGTVAGLIATAFRLYARALDDPFPYGQLLALWQLAEQICRVRPGQRQGNPVAIRLAWYARMTVSSELVGIEQLVNAIEAMRNKYVHSGSTHGINEEDVNIFKTVCEGALSTLVVLADYLTHLDQLDEVYVTIGRDRNYPERAREAHEAIAKLEAKLRAKA